MYQTEKKLYQALKTNLTKVHWQRIETGALQQGVPDVNACYHGTEFWLELKCTSTDTVSLTPFQCSWHMRRASVGGRSWILVAHSKHNVLTLHRGSDALSYWTMGFHHLLHSHTMRRLIGLSFCMMFV